jgi:transcriptional antiterminator RfaH
MNTKNVAWFCLRSKLKNEHVAAAHLRKMDDVHVFLPRVRFKRATRQGSVWVKEALFPGYLFARFDWQTSFRQVQYASGVRGIVHFGKYWPIIPEKSIEELRQVVGTAELHTISQTFSPGDAVRIADGALRGLHAVFSRVMPGRDRVAVLMELLGQQTMIELEAATIVREGNERMTIFQDQGNSLP